MCASRLLLRLTGLRKNMNHTFMFRERFGVSLRRFEGRFVKHFGGFFYQTTLAQPIGERFLG
jgi:hypothetical protein